MTSQQSWNSCKYAVASGAGGEMGYELAEHGLHEAYECENGHVVGLRIYRTTQIQEADGSFKPMAHLFGLMIPDTLAKTDADELEDKVSHALVACQHCRFFEQK